MAEPITRTMTENPITVTGEDTVRAAAKIMRDLGVGSVIVSDGDNHINGLLTDRDIVIRCLAEGMDPDRTMAASICSKRLTTLRPDDTDEDAVEQMREHAVRRLPVVDEDGSILGMVSMGDLALKRDPTSALAEVSKAPANR